MARKPTINTAPVEDSPVDETIIETTDEGATSQDETVPDTVPEDQPEQAPHDVMPPDLTPAPVAADSVPTPEVITGTEPALASEPAVETAPLEVTQEDTAEVEAAVVEIDNTDPHVAKLNLLLQMFKEQNEQPGQVPEHFSESARTALAVTKYVIDKPKVEVLDALLAFFVAERDGVCSPIEYLKGSTTLSKFDEQKVGFLFNMFSDMSHRRGGPINSAHVAVVLGRQEIVGYYNRKRAGFTQDR